MDFLWTAPDTTEFRCECWLPVGETRAVLLCLHGLSGAASDFTPLGRAASQAGFAVHALNLRGQGHDPMPARRGHHLDLSEIEADLAAFGAEMASRHSGAPVFWCGESMGALLLAHLLASPRFSQPLAGAIFSVPVVQLHRPVPPWARHLLHVSARIFPRLRLHPSWFVVGRRSSLQVSRDEEFLAAMRISSHYIPAFTLGFLDTFEDLMVSSRESARHLQAPALVLAAGRDIFINVAQVESWFSGIAASDKTLHIYPEAYHVLWNDWDRAKVISDILLWLDAHLGEL